jgi:hypothetical protein
MGVIRFDAQFGAATLRPATEALVRDATRKALAGMPAAMDRLPVTSGGRAPLTAARQDSSSPSRNAEVLLIVASEKRFGHAWLPGGGDVDKDGGRRRWTTTTERG